MTARTAIEAATLFAAVLFLAWAVTEAMGQAADYQINEQPKHLAKW